MVDLSLFKRAPIWLRLGQLVFSICSFAPVAEGAPDPRFSFAIFCGVSTMVLALLFMWAQLASQHWAHGPLELAVDAVWICFWLGNMSALSASLATWHEASADVRPKANLQAGVAFAVLTLALLCTSLGVDAHEIRTGPAIVMPNPVVETVDGHEVVTYNRSPMLHGALAGAV